MPQLPARRGNFPGSIRVSDGKPHDVNVLEPLAPEPAAIHVMNRAELDFRWLYGLHLSEAFFDTQAEIDADVRLICSAPSD